MNIITITGYVGTVPETKYTKSGKAVCNFVIGVKQKYGDDTYWFKCTAWEKNAENIEKYVNKGTKLLVSGEMMLETYEVNGEKRMSPNINVSFFEFIGAKMDDAEHRPEESSKKGKKQKDDGQGFMNIPQGIDDELPFN